MPLWLTVIAIAVPVSSVALVLVGFLPGSKKSQTEASAEPADEPAAATGSIQPAWDEKAAHTDSWIWR